MKSIMAFVAVTALTLPALAAVTVDGSFSVNPGAGDTTGGSPSPLSGTFGLDANRRFSIQLDQSGVSASTTDTLLSDYLAARSSKTGRANLYSKVLAPLLQTVVTDISTSDGIKTLRDTVKTELDKFITQLVEANPDSPLSNPALVELLHDIVASWPKVSIEPTTVADVISQLEEDGILRTKRGTDLASAINQAQPSSSGAIADAMLMNVTPEPVSLALLALGGLMLLRRRVA